MLLCSSNIFGFSFKNQVLEVYEKPEKAPSSKIGIKKQPQHDQISAFLNCLQLMNFKIHYYKLALEN